MQHRRHAIRHKPASADRTRLLRNRKTRLQHSMMLNDETRGAYEVQMFWAEQGSSAQIPALWLGALCRYCLSVVSALSVHLPWAEPADSPPAVAAAFDDLRSREPLCSCVLSSLELATVSISLNGCNPMGSCSHLFSMIDPPSSTT